LLSSCGEVITDTSPAEKLDGINKLSNGESNIFKSIKNEIDPVFIDGDKDRFEEGTFKHEAATFIDSMNEFDSYAMNYLLGNASVSSSDQIYEGLDIGDSQTTDEPQKDVLRANDGPSRIKVKLLRVIDGDTLLVDEDGTEKYIRLIGIDTPESVHPDDSRNTEEGKSASDHTKALLFGIEYVFLEKDVKELDAYGRTLAYVWLSEESGNILDMLNIKIIDDGFAVPMPIEPNIKYKNTIQGIYEKITPTK
ncbi:MAG: thermonuclease family protein, partial [Lachnospiraceae bacterium]|nr:thermonuclease family protein [Lachnospiraceae bacterium]